MHTDILYLYQGRLNAIGLSAKAFAAKATETGARKKLAKKRRCLRSTKGDITTSPLLHWSIWLICV